MVRRRGSGLPRVVARGVLAPGGVALVLLMVAGAFTQAATVALRAPVMPGAAHLAGITARLLPSLLALALPAALLVGLLAGLGPWARDGTWTALRAAGLPGRRLLVPVLGPALLVAVVMAAVTHQVGPGGRRAAGRMLAEATAQVRLVPGRFVALDGTVLHRTEDGALAVFQGDRWLRAATGRVLPTADGLVLALEDGAGRGGPWSVTFHTARVPLDGSAVGRRVELEERSDGELADLVRRMEQAGREAAYERAVLVKRTTLPLCALLLPLVALPLALRWGGRPGHGLLVVLGWWGLVRVGDGAVAVLGAGLAASLPLLGLAVTGVVLWATWRDR